MPTNKELKQENNSTEAKKELRVIKKRIEFKENEEIVIQDNISLLKEEEKEIKARINILKNTENNIKGIIDQYIIRKKELEINLDKIYNKIKKNEISN